MALESVQTALDVLESISCQSPEWESSLLGDLKVQLRFLRTFYMCGRKWGKGELFESTLLNIEETVHEYVQKIQSICDDDRVASNTKWDNLHKGVSEFLVCIKQSFRQEMKQLYLIISDGSFQTSSSSQEVELMGIMDSLIHNLRDLLEHKKFRGASTEPIEGLEENVRFLKNFILFAMFCGLEYRQMEDLLTYIAGLVVNAARLTFMSWYSDHPMMSFRFYQLVERIQPVESHVWGIYVGVLQASKLSLSSHHPTPGSHILMSGNFADSLLALLWKLLFIGTSYMDIFNHQMQKLYDRLTFLRTILRGLQNKFDELYEKMLNLIGIVICEAGIIICYLFVKEKEGMVKKLEPLFQDLEEKFKLIKAVEETQKYPLMLASYFPQTNMLGFIDIIAEEIKLIKVRVSETFHSKRQITEVQNMDKTYSMMPLAGEIPVLNELVVGLGFETSEIVARLTRGRKQLNIISIVGMPGLGKTTLAKKVCNHPYVRSHFHVLLWCSVSQIYDIRSLLLDILGGVDHNCLDKYFYMNEVDLSVALYIFLKHKRYLIILDDVWDTAVLNSLQRSFPNDANGSRILLTSRYHNVASHSELYILRFLTNDESWELLQKKMSYQGFPPALLGLGMEIAQHCKGLPLMILTVADILSNMKQDIWEEVAESLRKGTLSITEQCMKTLELSYIHLPDHLKPCFLYFGAFQEHRQIPVRKLLWLWIAEGFVEKTERGCLEDVAKGYMMELIQRSLVMAAEIGSRGRVKSCFVHDLVLAFCKAKCSEEHFLHCLRGHELGSFIEPSILYRLHVHSRIEDFVESRILCPRLRTLFLVADFERRYARRWYDIINKFCQSKLLRVLVLKGIHVGPFFPREIELLVHLRYFALAIKEKTFIIPSSIDNLSNLETFLVEGRELLVSLPDTVWNMKKLKHLSITGAFACWKLPEEHPKYRSNLENLQTLTTVKIFCGKTMMEEVRKFPNIRSLKCELDMADCEILALDFMSQLESLTILSRCNQLDDLHFQFPQNLKKLVLSRFFFSWSKISAIDTLPNLEVLKLLDNAFTGKIWDVEEGKFTKLRFLKLANLDLACWTGSEDTFPCLEKLVLERCWFLEEVPSSLTDIPTLKMIEVSHCNIASSLIENIQEMQMDMGNQDLKILIHPRS